MNATPKSLPTRVFRAGNSQAVRIPKAFELPEGEVRIERRAGGLFIADQRGDWASFFAQPSVDFPFAAKELRDNRPERAVDVTWIDALSTGARRGTSRKASKKSARKPARKAAKKSAR